MAQPGKQSPLVEPGGEAPVAREWACAAGLLDCVVVVSAPLAAEQPLLVGACLPVCCYGALPRKRFAGFARPAHLSKRPGCWTAW